MRFLLVSLLFLCLSAQAFGYFSSRGGLLLSVEGGYQNFYSIMQINDKFYPLVRIDGPVASAAVRIFTDKYMSIDLGVNVLMNVNTNDDILIPHATVYQEQSRTYNNIVIPVNMISPVFRITTWFDHFGFGMGAFYAFITQPLRSYEITDGYYCGGGFVSLEYAFTIEMDSFFVAIAPYASLGVHVNNIHVNYGDQIWGIGYNWAIGCKVDIPLAKF